MRKRFLTIVSAVAINAAIFGSYAISQTVNPQVSSVLPTDVVQVISGTTTAGPGFQYAPISLLRGSNQTNGLSNAGVLRMLEFKNNDGTTLSVSASSGKFGLTSTPGTVLQLLTEAANSNTKTDIAQIEYIVSGTYVAGTNITVTANTDYTLGSGTVGTHTLAAAAYLTANAGTQGATLIATAAQTVPATAGDVTFTITGATLTPGAHLLLTFTLVIQDSGGSNITAHLNSVRLS